MIAAVIPLNNIMSKTPKKSDASHQTPKSLVNPIGLIGAVLSAIALAIGLYSSSIIDSLESRKVPNRHYETHDATIITDKAGNAFTFVEQAIIFVGRARLWNSCDRRRGARLCRPCSVAADIWANCYCVKLGNLWHNAWRQIMHYTRDNNSMNTKPLGHGLLRSPRIASLLYPLRQIQYHPRLGYRGRYVPLKQCLQYSAISTETSRH